MNRIFRWAIISDFLILGCQKWGYIQAEMWKRGLFQTHSVSNVTPPSGLPGSNIAQELGNSIKVLSLTVDLWYLFLRFRNYIMWSRFKHFRPKHRWNARKLRIYLQDIASGAGATISNATNAAANSNVGQSVSEFGNSIKVCLFLVTHFPINRLLFDSGAIENISQRNYCSLT